MAATPTRAEGSESPLALRAGDVVVVTGGARGIGRAIARHLAAKGARIAVLDVRNEGAETAAMCGEAGGEGMFVRCDVSRAAEIETAAARVSEAWGAPFGLVNDAGVYARHALLEMPLEDWERTLAVNLTGTFLATRGFAPAMIAAGRGAIVNISSGAALRGVAGGGAYAASKAGILSLTKTFALELAPHVRVNAVLPGVTETDMPLAATDIEELRGRGQGIPLGRIGQPEDIARVTGFLLGGDAAYVTGQGLGVSGGRFMAP